MYRPGDYVYPTDLPKPVLCRVQRADNASAGKTTFQILTLTPLEGPWRDMPGTPIVRLSEAVRPAKGRQLWRRGPRPVAAAS